VNAISKMVAAILAVLLLYVYPIADSYEKQDEISFLMTNKLVVNFVDSVRNKGHITPTMYNDFVQALELTGNTFDIHMEHLHKRYTPVYTDPANSETFQSKFDVNYEGFYHGQIMAVLFPDNDLLIDNPSRIYKLTVGDYISVTVRNTNRTNATLLRDFLNQSNTGDSTIINIPYGGMVLNENY
jgi:hypothetical protein